MIKPKPTNHHPQPPTTNRQVHYAATIAGMSFANAFLGICHSMAHKLGARFHVPHGLANAALVSHVIRYNAVSTDGWMDGWVDGWVGGVLELLGYSLAGSHAAACSQSNPFPLLAPSCFPAHHSLHHPHPPTHPTQTDCPYKQAALPQHHYPRSLVEYSDLADMLGLGGGSQEEKVVRLIAAVEELKAKLDIPLTIREIVGAEREPEYLVGCWRGGVGGDDDEGLRMGRCVIEGC